MRIQLWSYNYDPEPSGIGPLSGVAARALAARGHRLEVVSAHPHYPEPAWGARGRPYRERRNGIPVVRLPLWIGRQSVGARLRQEATFVAALAAAAPLLSTPEVILAVSPSFPALAPAMAQSAARGVPWVLWLQDILPDGAAATGLISEGRLLNAARSFERLAYRRASRIVVISDSFAENLRTKGVPASKIDRVFNPASRPIRHSPRPEPAGSPPTVLTMGNIGHTQNLVAVTEAFEASEELERLGARLVIAGEGVCGDAVRRAIRTDRVEVTGVLGSEALEARLRSATVALVSQRYEGIDFNVPSKLMNFMGYGIPVVAFVRELSEVARIVSAADAGWVADGGDLEAGARTLAAALTDPDARRRRGEAALRFARRHFEPERVAGKLERALLASVQSSPA